MPRLSDEFRDENGREEGGAEAERPARAAQPVTKPAPMAPRAPARPAAPAPSAPQPDTSEQTAAAAPPRASTRMPDNTVQEALAEKLRAQRAAAERLAEQRVQAARERAEGKAAVEAAPRPQPQPQPPAARVAAAPAAPPPKAARAAVPPSPAGTKPKFSFAEDNPPAPAAVARPSLSPGASAPLTPPRPALGGERGQPPFLRPSVGGGAAGRAAPPPYRPVDSSSANYGAPPRLQPPPVNRASYGAEGPAGGYSGARAAPARRAPPPPPPPPPPSLDTYRSTEPRDFTGGDSDDGRQTPRLGRPAVTAARGRSSQDDFDEVFEDEGGSRRASARDYQSAYREGGEDVFGDDQRRSSGPWMLLLALLAAALVTGGVVWYFNSGTGGTVAGDGQPSGNVPVVAAPEDPAKVAPEAPAAGTESPAAKKKQIYDRIVGEQEVIGGQVQPTEEIPVEPAAASQPADAVPAVEPTGATQIPTPDAAGQDSGTGEGLPSVDEPPPLPLPPAGSDQQGSLGQRGTQQVAATSAQPEQGSTAPPVGSSEIPAPSSSVAAPLPPPEKATDGAALASGAGTVTGEPTFESNQVDDTAAIQPPETTPAPAPEAEPAPAKKKPSSTTAANAAKKKPPAEKSLGSEPVVLVPPAKIASNDMPEPPAPEIQAPAVEAAPQPEKKRRTIMDLFRGSEGATESQVAALNQAPQPAPAAPAKQAPAQKPAKQQPAAAGGSGFVIQLASFRSEAEARKEYSRLAGAYPAVVGGLPQQIRQTSVGGSTRYQLGLGPLSSRSAATKVCSELISAGESDCIVRGL